MQLFARKPQIPSHIPAERIYDFDVFQDSTVGGDVHKTHMALHRQAPDIFYTPHNGGHWMATRFDDARQIMTTPEVFSSRDALYPPQPPFLHISLPPQDMDAPDHMRYRLLMLKFLAPREVASLEPQVRQLITALIDNVIDRGRAEFVADVSVPLPVKTFMQMMHMDLSRYTQFVGWANDILGSESAWRRFPAFLAMTHYLKGLIRQRKKTPGDDPVSVLLRSEVQDERLTDKRVLEMCNLLFLAGLDTVTNAMTFITKHLAENPDVQQRLRDNPEQISAAIEEFLRRYSFVNVPRRVVSDTEIGGAKLRKGDLIVASFAAASNDERSVANPEKLDLDREKSPHLAFNTGPHNCAGMHLARMELRVFLEEWLRRIPQFSIAPGYQPKARGGPVMALETLDIIW